MEGCNMRRKHRWLNILLICSMMLGIFATLPQQQTPVHAGWADGWTVTESDVPKWSGSNVAANQSGDPKTNPLALPQTLPNEQVAYYQMNKMADGCLALPELANENVTYYAVYSPEQFRYAMANALNIKLMNDIDMRGQDGLSWTAVSFTRKVFIDGNGHKIYNLNGGALVSTWTQPLIVKNLMVSSANLNSGIFTGTNADTYISMEGVSLEHAVVQTASFGGGLLCNSYYRGGASAARVYANLCHTKNVYVKGGACSGNIFGPISGYIENCYAIDGTMRTNNHSGAFTSCAGNYIIKNCFTNVRAYASGNTGAFVGHVEDSYYTPGGSHTSQFINCYASGSVEGDGTNLGGFCAGAGQAADHAGGSCQYLFENCYSTAMVGMLNNQSYQGGFLGNQENNAITTIRHCFAAGEVGALGTDLNNASLLMGGFVGARSGGQLIIEDCYYDKQTTAMKEKGIGGSMTGVTGSDQIHGLLTQDLMTTLPDGKTPEESDWILADGTYPQLKVFANNQTYTGMDKSNADAYSKASVCTAILYPSNLSEDEFEKVDQTDYDTVRSLRFLFPLTNNTLANTTDGSYDISWVDGGDKCQVDGMEDASIVVIKDTDSKNPKDDYSVISLAPGRGYATVSVERNGAVGKRTLRLIPTSAITVTQGNQENVSSGLDATIYAVPKGETIDEDTSISYLTFKEVTYDHRIGMFFASGNDQGQNVQRQTLEGMPQETIEDFETVVLNEKPGGTVVTSVQKKQSDGKLQPVTMTEELLALFTGDATAQMQDIGEYYFTYRWYLNSANVGATSGYLETTKKLTILPGVTPQFYRNFDNQDQTRVYLDPSQIPTGQKALYYKNGDPLQTLPTPPTRDGYFFAGWSLNRTIDLTKENYITETTKIDTDWANKDYLVPMYAIWEPNPHKITIHLPDGTEIEVDSAVDRDIIEDLKDHVPPDEDGKKFVGWTTDPDHPKTDIDPEDVLGDEDITVYPVWEADPTIKKEVENLTHTDRTMVGDHLRYTITVNNLESNSIWFDAYITDHLPQGVSYIHNSMKLIQPDGTEENLPDTLYDESQHTITYSLGDVVGKKTYVLQFDVIVNGHAIDREHPENKDITNIVTASGKNPDGTTNLPKDEHYVDDPTDPEDKPGESSATPEGGVNVLPIDPKGEVKKEAVNLTHQLGQSHVQDRVRYTITVSNIKSGSMWYDVSVQDEIPVGLEIDLDSIYIETPDHRTIPVDGSAYDATTRMLGVYLGHIFGDESYQLIFEAKITEEALGKDIGNMAIAIGTQPSDVKSDPKDPVDPEEMLKPGEPYHPEEDEKIPLLPDGTPATSISKTSYPSYPFVRDEISGDGTGVLPFDPRVNTGDNTSVSLYIMMSSLSLCTCIKLRRKDQEIL